MCQYLLNRQINGQRYGQAKPEEQEKLQEAPHLATDQDEATVDNANIVTGRNANVLDFEPSSIDLGDEINQPVEVDRRITHAQFVFESDQGERLMREILRFLSDDLSVSGRRERDPPR